MELNLVLSLIIQNVTTIKFCHPICFWDIDFSRGSIMSQEKVFLKLFILGWSLSAFVKENINNRRHEVNTIPANAFYNCPDCH